MTRNEALEIARTNEKAHRQASIDFTLRRRADFDEAKYGYLHGWFQVGAFCFCREEITGERYDHDQGGWAFV